MAEQIRRWMKQQRLRVADVAALCGVSSPAVSQWRSGKSNPKAEHLVTLMQNGLKP